MGKVLLAIVAAFACLVLVESLTCNQCTFNLLGQCVGRGSTNCSSNNSVCFTDRYSFSVFSGNMMFNSTGCRESNATCSSGLSGTVMTVASVVNLTWSTTTSCCTTDRCNSLTLNSAPSTKMSFTVAAAGAVLASVWGSML